MNTIFRVVGMLSDRRTVTRYIRLEHSDMRRALSAVRVRAYKAFGMRAAAIGIASEQQALAFVGTVGYDAACNASETHAETGAQLRSMQKHGGADNTGRTMYKPSAAQAVKLSNKANAYLAQSGLGALLG